MRTTKISKFLILGLALLLSNESAFAKKMYRWVDENGNVYFSDQVPPEQAKHKRETLSEKARVVDVLEKAKTPEQIEQEKRLDALRKEQERIVAQQASSDKVLLSTFRSLEDINTALANKLAGLDAAQKVIEGNIMRYEQQLQQQQKQAADYERNNNKVPDKLLADIGASKQQIEATKQELDRHLLKRQAIEKEFRADMARFQFLTQQPSGDVKKTSQSLAESNANNALGLFVCHDAAQCDKAWKIAGEFVAKHSTTGPDVETDKLIMRAPPIKDDDLSLSASKLDHSSGQQQIFLDIRCRPSTQGLELCASGKVQTLRQEFAPFIQSQLTSQQ
ncbi:MAG: DUF4124 domain-containing protein [Methylomonas sp.]